MATTVIADLVQPDIFTSYGQILTEKKSRLVRSGAVVRDAFLDSLLSGGGGSGSAATTYFNIPSFKDLDDDTALIASEANAVLFGGTAVTPKRIQSAVEKAVRCSRGQVWSASQLAAALSGTDPLSAIQNLTSSYWARHDNAMFIALVKGLLADNAAAPGGSDTHTQNDLTFDVSGSAYDPGVTDFSAEAFLDALQTMGDSQDQLGLVMVHSVVYNRMLKNDLIDFESDSEGKTRIARFMGKTVIVDDNMINASNVYDTWIFGEGAIRLGFGSPQNATEVSWSPDGGNGFGQEALWNRRYLMWHPTGHSFVATPASIGGPTNAELEAAASWSRVYPERKQIKIARLKTREA
jgi:hypothetical protein